MALAISSIFGGVDAKAEKITQASITIAPSRQTPAKDLTNCFAIPCVGSPADEDNGIVAIATYKYNLKNLP